MNKQQKANYLGEIMFRLIIGLVILGASLYVIAQQFSLVWALLLIAYGLGLIITTLAIWRLNR